MKRLIMTVARTALLTMLAASSVPGPAVAYQDTNGNRLDDIIESIRSGGWVKAFENDDPAHGRMLVGVENPAAITYALYVGYNHHPTVIDETMLRTTGVTMAWSFENVDVTETRATWAQAQSILALPGVTRVEAVPVMYATNHYGARTVRARDSRGLAAAENYVLFPSVQGELGLDGTGIVIAILDTGVNDETDIGNPGYPGHEALKGKFLGGGEFFSGQPALNTGLDASVNPQDHGAEASSYHATHVAGSAMGTGGLGRYFQGVAPGARLVDCKVLSDAGASVGGSERGLDWVIHNRNKLWTGQLPGSIWQGIDVVNMSLGSPTSNDNGASTSAQLVNTAVDNGIVVCIASGNDSRGTGAAGSTTEAGMASPASADKCIAVGASATQHSLLRSDDLVTDFSNEGPRKDDGDADHLDEMKPSIVAPGAGILSADGDFLSDGSNNKQLSGTSMACPHVAGCAALVRQANPLLTPLQVRTILQNTADHKLASVKGPFRTYAASPDPNYDPGSGYGLVDVYAACKEALNSTSGVQVVQIRPIARPQDSRVDVSWVTQREYPFLGFNIYRAPDVGGAPGAFTQLNPVIVPPSLAGDPVIQNDDNRIPYVYQDTAGLVPGQTYWYRIDWIDLLGAAHSEPPAPATYGLAPRVATVYYSIIHNAADNDLLVRVGTDAQYSPGNLGQADFETLGPGESRQDSSRVVFPIPANTGTSTIGTVEHFWSVGFTASDNIGGYLPPRIAHPWFLHVTEGGYVNRQGRVSSFSMFVNSSPGSPSGQIYVTNHIPMPQPTLEGGLAPVTLWIPEQSPVPVVLGRFEALADADAISLVLELTSDSRPSGLRVHRSTTADFETREAMGDVIPMHGSRFTWRDPNAEPDQAYTYWVEIMDRDGGRIMAGPVTAVRPSTLVSTRAPVPAANPVRGGTTLRYVIGNEAVTSGRVPVRLTLHDIQGREVAELFSGESTPGAHALAWNAQDGRGGRLASGTYFTRLVAGRVTVTGRVVVVN